MRSSDQINNSLSKIHDKQIYSSKHDEILYWLNNKILDNWSFLHNYTQVERDLGKQTATVLTTTESCGSKFCSQMNGDIFVECNIEKPLMHKNHGTPIGFSDLTVELYSNVDTKQYYSNNDALYSEYKDKVLMYLLNIEIKTDVNIGETLRQINYYNSMSGSRAGWAVCAPPFSGSELLKQQGVYFIPYEPGL